MRYFTNQSERRLTSGSQYLLNGDWSVESLERRELLAGLVTVAVSTAGDITITGDQQGNDIDIDIIG